MFYKGKRDRSAEIRSRQNAPKAPTSNIIDLIRKLNENHKEIAKKTLKTSDEPAIKERKIEGLYQSLLFLESLH